MKSPYSCELKIAKNSNGTTVGIFSIFNLLCGRFTFLPPFRSLPHYALLWSIMQQENGNIVTRSGAKSFDNCDFMDLPTFQQVPWNMAQIHQPLFPPLIWPHPLNGEKLCVEMLLTLSLREWADCLDRPASNSLLCRNVAAVVGSLYVVRLVWSQLWQLLGGFCAFFLAPWGISRINLKKYGPWAGGLVPMCSFCCQSVSFRCQSDSCVHIPLLV